MSSQKRAKREGQDMSIAKKEEKPKNATTKAKKGGNDGEDTTGRLIPATQKRCSKCKYSTKIGTGPLDVCCYYIAITGKPRIGSIGTCGNFEKGERNNDTF